MDNNQSKSWSSDFEIGESEIDKKFYNLFTVLDDLIDLKESNRIDYDLKMNRILGRLEKFALEFANLDREFIISGETEDIDQYVVNSQKLISKVEEFILHFNSNNRLLLEEIINFLKKWLMVQLAQARKIFL